MPCPHCLVSSLLSHHFRPQIKCKPGTLILPVLLTQRDKFRIRLETAHFLGKHGILADDLTFLDDLELEGLSRTEGVTLTATLVDHHVLSPAEEFLRHGVVEVLDHRPLEGVLPNSWNAEVEQVGSCATLIARKMLASEEFTLDSTVAELLLGTILSDTGNMSTSDNIATPVDHEVLVKLKSFLPPSLSATSIYDEIKAAKFNLSSLTVSEILAKDLKVLKGTQITVAMSTITMDIEDFLSRPEFDRDASEFCAALPADVLIIMAFVTGDVGIVNRWIAIYSTNRVYQHQLIDVLMNSTNPSLELEPLNLGLELSSITVFTMNNLQASRKKVLPLIHDFLAGEMTTSDENLNSSGQFAYIDSGERGDTCEEETRRHINLAKTFQSDQFRTSQDRFDLAAVGAEALISPSLSSDSEAVCQDGASDGEIDQKEEADKQHLDHVLEYQSGSGDFFAPAQKASSTSEFQENLIDFDTLSDHTESLSTVIQSDPGEVSHVNANQDVLPPPLSNGHIHFTESDLTSTGDGVLLAEDVLQNHTPFDLLCPTSVDSPLDIASMPTSGQASGQGSKVPSYPDTPPNSFMEASGVVYFKETQLPSFNSSEMVKRIQAKKAALAGHTGLKESRYDNIEDEDSFDLLGVGGTGSSGGSLISPAVPQNSYMDLTVGFQEQIPKLANSDILERVKEKRSQFEWNVETLDGPTGVEEHSIPVRQVHVEPFTPQNSYIEGSFDSYARAALPSMNSAEIVAKIKAKQSAMFGGSGSSDESGGCQSPDIGAKSPRIPSPYTPQNSYRDSLQLLESRNIMPDLNEVAERLSVEHAPKSQFGGGAREEDLVNTNHQNHTRSVRHSSSQSDSQNTMSDVDSLMSVSTDVGTPSENIVASSLASLMKSEMGLLSRKDTCDSDVFGPVVKSDDNASCDNDGKRSDGLPRANHIGSPPRATFIGEQGQRRENRRVGFNDKDLFSPVEENQLHTLEDHAFYQAAENIVAQSVAAALRVSKGRDRNDSASSTSGGRLRWNDNTVLNYIEDNDGQEDEDNDGQEDEDNDDQEDEDNDGQEDKDNDGQEDEDSVSEADSGNIECSDVADQVSDDQEVPVDWTNSNTAKCADGLKSSPAKLDTMNMNDVNSPISPTSEEVEHVAEVVGNHVDTPDEHLQEIALKELAYEFANELIQSVLNDFPFNENSDNCREGASGTYNSAQSSRKYSSEKFGSFDSNSSAIPERRYSKETDLTSSIIEDELSTSFKERKPSEELISEDNDPETKSFPYRKISRSEDFQSRRVSWEDNTSRRSSRMEDSDYESSIKREDLETDYLPNMDPLQGNLDIIDASYSKITDVDREVVEGESFRKASGEQLSDESESNNNGMYSNGVQVVDDEETMPEEAFSKMASKSRKKIRVSFSEDFDDDIGDFNIQSSSRTHLRSPPPPVQSQDSLSSSPPSQDQLELEDYPQDLPSAGAERLYEVEEEVHPAPITAHEQVGRMIESAEETLAEIDRDLDFFNTDHSLPSPTPASSVTLALASNPELPSLASHAIITPHVNTVLNVSHDPLMNAVSPDPLVTSDPNHRQDPAAGDSEQPSSRLTATRVFSDPLHTHARNLSSTSFGSIKGAVYTEEWQDDEIVEMAAQSGLDATSLDPLRKKIVPDSSCLQAIADNDVVGSEDEEEEPDSESESGDLEWENDTPVKTPPRPGIEPTLSTEAATDTGHARWKRVSVSGAPFDIDLQAIEPYRNVLSHGGYYAEGLNAIIVFYGCHLPSRRREDYAYVMNHLFHYVIHTLEELVADDYVIIYFHGSTPRRQMPGLSWLKRCYQSIDRRLKKNLKGLFLVHPTLWLKTIVTMIRPFISSKFSSKLKFVRSLEELNSLVPMANVTIPEAITQLEELMKQNPHYLEEQEEEERMQMKEEEKVEKKKDNERKKKEKDQKKLEESERKLNAKLEKEKKKQEKEREKERKKAEQKTKSKK
ncbi:hypothetical protein Btru_063736 [Bulinus truncatus]|nr:hypothetical protein Btru_063736 [Bulinus truncatus]